MVKVTREQHHTHCNLRLSAERIVTVISTIPIMSKPLRWGICSSGKISADFVAAVQGVPLTASHNKIEAVAARDKAKAAEFAKRFNIPKTYGSYEELANDPDIDVVYIGVIHPGHKAASILYLNHGKHVLCEKPMTLNFKDAVEVIETAKAKKLFFMEGFWSRTFPVYRKVREYITSGRIGKPLVVTGRFMVPINAVDRVRLKELGGGGLLDIGCYVVTITNLVFPGKPVSLKVEGTVTDEGVDANGAILLHYSNGGVASLVYDTRINSFENNEFFIGGSKGSIKIHAPFWCPTKLTGPEGVEEFPLPQLDHNFNFGNSQGLAYEAEEVYQCISKGFLETPVMTHEDSLSVMYILDELLKQLNVHHG